MTVAYVTIQKTDQGYNLKVVATYQPSLLDGIYGFWGTKKEARADAAARGFSTRLPTLAEIRASVSHHPYHENFFSRKLCKLYRDPSPMRVTRSEDGLIGITNGRSFWRWDGEDLHRVLD